jgi:acyl-CoA synthetase (AMP-forming)/AMP-acid ligase II
LVARSWSAILPEQIPGIEAPMRIADYFERSASLAPDQELVVEGETRLTYGRTRPLVHAIAHALSRAEGLKPGAHVAIYAPNDHRLGLAQLGISRADMAWAMAHTGSSLEVNIRCLDYLDCEWLFFHSQFEAHIPALLEGVPKLRGCVCLDARSAYGPSLSDWIAEAPSEPFPYRFPNPQAAAFFALTGGTTGPAKAVAHTHQSTEMGIISMFSTLGIGPGARHLVVAPLSHAAGYLSQSFVARGGTNVILPGFDADAVLATIERERITHLFLPPTAVYALLAHPRSAVCDFSSLRCFVVGAAPMAPEKFRQAIQLFGPIMHDVYGQTETMFPILVRSPADYLLPDGSLDASILPVTGRVAPLVHLEIIDDEGRVLPPGEAGEVAVRTAMLMSEYYKKPQETAEA